MVHKHQFLLGELICALCYARVPSISQRSMLRFVLSLFYLDQFYNTNPSLVFVEMSMECLLHHLTGANVAL